jgi:general secretion pathway protein A
LIRAILTDFGLNAAGRDRLSYIEKLNAFLLEQLKKGNNVAIIIDEAQNLSTQVLEQIRLLSNLETDQHKLMQIVLCGQPELRERLMGSELRQLRQRITVRYHLHPLTEKEIVLYIEHRMKTAGWQEAKSPFTDEAITTIYSYSSGIPRLVNALCDVALLAGFVAGSKIIDQVCIAKAIQQLEGTE